MLVLLFFALQIAVADVRVVDGDTIDGAGVRYRIAALDAPEMNARCAGERTRAAAATAELQRLVREARRIEVFPTGDVQPARGNWRERVVARVEIDGVDVTDHMIDRGLGRPWPNRRSWC